MRRSWLWALVAVNLVAILFLTVVAVVHETPTDLVAVLLPLAFVAIGGLVARRQPDNREGWILLAIATSWCFALIAPLDGAWVPAVVLMATQLLIRFPNGELPSPRWRWFSRLTIALIPVLTFVVTSGGQLREDATPNPYYLPWVNTLVALVALLPVVMVASAASLVVRYRRATLLEREQIRWLAWAGAVVVVLYTVVLATSLWYDSTHQIDSSSSSWFANGYPTWLNLIQVLALVSFLLLPGSIGLAILRYRLYEIDRIISRTTSYALVSAVVVSTYALVVTAVSAPSPGSSSLAVAAATLAAAAVVRPLQRRIQAAVDRRFDRARYDGLQTVEAFGQRLRDVVDPDAVADALTIAVDRCLQPVSLSLWVVEP